MRLRPFVVCAFAMLLAPASASADFHFVSVREVFPGETGAPQAQYVEFQAYAAGQNFTTGHKVTFYDSSGAEKPAETFDKDVGDGRNQMTFVIATPEAETRFGISADETMAPNLISAGGGAVCWAALDCVSWGSFAGSLPSPAGSPAAAGGIPDGMALRRTIVPGCATLLEPFDDRDNSAVDFSAVFPSPRPNSVTPSERACGAAAGGQAGPNTGGSKGRVPQTVLERRPAQRSRDRTPTFRFRSGGSDVTFECKLDRRPFRVCRSPFTTRRLSLGRHAFRVRARDGSGRADPTPVFDAFRILPRSLQG
jgi:hypothetical protein